MKLIDAIHGSTIVIYIVAAFFIILAICLFFGKGKNMIAGYNDLSDEEKKKYDDKKLCRDFGIGMLVIGVFLLALGIFAPVLPGWTQYLIPIVFGIDALILLFRSFLDKNS